MTMLKARLYDLELKKREAATQSDNSNKTENGWGTKFVHMYCNHIRWSKTYVQMLKHQILKEC
jgi:protein subunit release factor B